MIAILFGLTNPLLCDSPGQNPSDRIPVVTGPVTGPGSVFCASVIDLSPYGYIEEEYFLEGKARRYDFKIDTGNTQSNGIFFPGCSFTDIRGIPGIAIPFDTLYPYKTRIIVRRPANPKNFNGTVIVEWLNVSSMYDIDPDWWHIHGYMMRNGYAGVGVSAQQAGVHSQTGLRKWNPARYGTLDLTAGSSLTYDELSYDVYTQAIKALKGSQKIKPLGSCKPEIVIASGHSQSALYLTAYYNFIQPVDGIIDGFIILGAGGKLRTDVPAKVFKINSETDLIELGQVAFRQPDNDHIITWEFAGTSHFDQTLLECYSALNKRDFGSFTPLECEQPLCTGIPFYYGFSAAVGHLDRWIRNNIIPPAGIQMTVKENGPAVVLSRDSFGNALGGIRLPQFDVPVAAHHGSNAGENFFCRFYGTHLPFDQRTLKALYPTHQDYMVRFKESVRQNLKSGYILAADTSSMLKQASNLSSLWD